MNAAQQKAAQQVEKATIRYNKTCNLFERAQQRELEAYQKLRNAIEDEKKEILEICNLNRPFGCIE